MRDDGESEKKFFGAKKENRERKYLNIKDIN